MQKAEYVSLRDMELKALIDAGVFKSKADAINEAVSTLFRVKPEMKLESAIQLYKDNKVTLGRAAEIAGLNRWEFTDILKDMGIRIVIECDSEADMDKRIQKKSLRDF